MKRSPSWDRVFDSGRARPELLGTAGSYSEPQRPPRGAGHPALLSQLLPRLPHALALCTRMALSDGLAAHAADPFAPLDRALTCQTSGEARAQRQTGRIREISPIYVVL